MLLGFIYLAGPIGLVVILAALPRGRAASWGPAGAAGALATVWAAWLMGLPPLFGGDPLGDALLVAALLLWTLAVALAALLQGLRPRLAAAGRLAYPLSVLGLLAVVLLAVTPILGL